MNYENEVNVTYCLVNQRYFSLYQAQMMDVPMNSPIWNHEPYGERNDLMDDLCHFVCALMAPPCSFNVQAQRNNFSNGNFEYGIKSLMANTMH